MIDEYVENVAPDIEKIKRIVRGMVEGAERVDCIDKCNECLIVDVGSRTVSVSCERHGVDLMVCY